MRRLTRVAKDSTVQESTDAERTQLATDFAALHQRVEGIVDSVPGVVWESWEEEVPA